MLILTGIERVGNKKGLDNELMADAQNSGLHVS